MKTLHLPYTLDSQPIGHRARIGCVVLASDYTVEHEFRTVMARSELNGVALYQARIANSPDINPNSLRAMEPLLRQTAETLLPGDTLDVLAYGCTSASMVLGANHVNETLRVAKPGVQATNPASAAVAAMHALGARNIAVLTPYRDDVNEAIAEGLGGAGLNITAFGTFNEQSDQVVCQIDVDSIAAAIETLLGASSDSVDAVFVSCTSIAMLHAIENMEERFGRPVVSSNQAMIWHSLRLAGVTDALPGFGSLFAGG